jgi:cbb3-type cytochrome oxidase subunit 3
MVSEATIPGLEKLHDIVVPAPVSWAPQAPGWYVVFGLVLLGVGWWIYRRLRRFRKNRYRRLALKELTVIERQLQQPERRAEALAEIPALLKWTALAAFPRSEVAALTGEQWLAFLDRNLGGKDFKEGPGRFLSELAYAPAEKTARFSDESIRNLLQLIRRWTKRHEMS